MGLWLIPEGAELSFTARVSHIQNAMQNFIGRGEVIIEVFRHFRSKPDHVVIRYCGAGECLSQHLFKARPVATGVLEISPQRFHEALARFNADEVVIISHNSADGTTDIASPRLLITLSK